MDMEIFPLSPADILLKGLDVQRKEGTLCDVTICVDDREFHAHKCVLAVLSPYFKAMFDGNFKERSENVVNLRDVVSADGLGVILDAIYTPKLRLTHGNVMEVTVAADFLGIEKIVARCETFMYGHLCYDFCAGYFQVARKLSMDKLLTRAREVVVKEFIEMTTTDGFANLDLVTVCEIFSAQDLVLDGQEVEVFRGMCRWLEDKDLPEEQVDKVLTNSECIQYTSIPKKVLKEEVLQNEFIIANDVRRKNVQAALEFHANVYKQPILLIEGGSKPRGIPCFVSVGTKRIKFKDKTKTARPRLMFLKVDPDKKALRILKEIKFSVPLEQGTMCCITHGKVFVFVYGSSTKGFVFFRYSIPLGTWLKLDTPPIQVKSAMMQSSKNMIYLLGGINNSGRRVDSCFEYNIEDNTWEKMPRMPAKLSFAGICVHSTKNIIYIAGGYSGWGIAVAKVNSLYGYHIETMTWYIEAPLRHKRSGLCLLEVDAHIYAIGGLEDESDTKNEIIEEYNIELNQWTIIELHCQSFPHLYFPEGVKVFNVEGLVVVAGIQRTCDCSDYEYLIELNPNKQFKLKRAISMVPDYKWEIFGYVQVPL